MSDEQPPPSGDDLLAPAGYDLVDVRYIEVNGSYAGHGLLRTHGRRECSGPNCPIHNPSEHPLADAPLLWREDGGFMERLCPHGVGHPDVDRLAHTMRTQGESATRRIARHACDGCCL
ncbi:hypothetical protein IC607_02525 [Cellulomonas sp. JH27-2]|uniref:hypothetical protein n=1 Tax=Cellulomonas sp. JH27-2 TaxID=2774139 RepID=UPI001786BF7C|nr:hypothetical protein [Cellulomonas sp. JH27-2]MBD8057841.1 hypothetical protein [Cellulomonas sp. JH27-2]